MLHPGTADGNAACSSTSATATLVCADGTCTRTRSSPRRRQRQARAGAHRRVGCTTATVTTAVHGCGCWRARCVVGEAEEGGEGGRCTDVGVGAGTSTCRRSCSSGSEGGACSAEKRCIMIGATSARVVSLPRQLPCPSEVQLNLGVAVTLRLFPHLLSNFGRPPVWHVTL